MDASKANWCWARGYEWPRIRRVRWASCVAEEAEVVVEDVSAASLAIPLLAAPVQVLVEGGSVCGNGNGIDDGQEAWDCAPILLGIGAGGGCC